MQIRLRQGFDRLRLTAVDGARGSMRKAGELDPGSGPGAGRRRYDSGKVTGARVDGNGTQGIAKKKSKV